jgi:peptidoglycan hydrolase-like protein with peptidoglycan-binding domain
MPDCPQKKRGLTGGENGKDVQAVQRAVYKGLEGVELQPINLRNGNYGAGTAADVRAFQREIGLQPTGYMGQPTLEALWQFFDAYGRSLYFKALIGKATDLPGGRLQSGQRGQRVRAAQQMLWRALGDEAQNIRNGVYGAGVEADVRHFCGIADLPRVSGKEISQSLWAMLWGFGDVHAQDLAGSTPSKSSEIRSNLITWAEWYVRQGGKYLQARPYERDVPPVLPLANDCSGSVSHLFKLSGGPDPSGNGFSGSGYTGTMQTRGARISLSDRLLPGDLIFYGVQAGGVAQHVVMHLDADRIFTFGATPPTITSYSTYWRSGRRTDIGARRYLP